MIQSRIEIRGSLSTKLLRGGIDAPIGWKLRNQLRWGYLKGWMAKNIFGPFANVFGIATITGELSAIKYLADGSYVDYGILGRQQVTTAYCEFIVDQHQTESSVIGDYKYHDSGEGATGENVTDTDIESSDGVSRATGTQTEGTSVQYRSVGTISYTSTLTLREHGLFSASTGATLMDRTVFAAIGVVNGDSVQYTYTISYVAGS